MSGGVDESKIDELMESFEKSKAKKDEPQRKKKEKARVILAKYFLHGIAFYLIFIGLAVVWALGLFVLVMVGYIIGLIIGLGMLMLIIGGLNAFLTSILWFPVKISFWSLVGHGMTLFIVLIIADVIFVMAPSYAFPGIVTEIVTFIVGSLINGFVGKSVAGIWKEEYSEEGQYESPEVL